MRARTVAALAALTALTACGAIPARHDGTRAGGRFGCMSTVHGVADGPGSLMATWLPRDFRLQAGAQPGSSLPQSVYLKVSRHPDPPRLMLGSAFQRGPLTAADGGRGHGMPVLINGHHGLLESGPPSPQFIGVYWKPGRGYLVSVVGYEVPAPIVLKVAKEVSFVAPGVVALPVTPGPIVTRQAAISAAERATRVRWRHAEARLSSWTEIQALAVREQQVAAAPRVLNGTPWRPVWAVLLTGSHTSQTLAVVDAASGQEEFTIRVHGSWFRALTDRDPASTRRCPGGSSALIAFGVLTRDEQAYVARRPATSHARTSVQLVLSTVPAVNKADTGLFGGCVQQNCSIDQLVWVTITTVRANPGKTVACLPGSVSVPAGYKPKQVKQYYSVEVPDSVGIGCGKVPDSLRALSDLAPP